jgi:hypothetical protein
MRWMRKSSSWQSLGTGTALLALLLAVGCSHSPVSDAQSHNSSADRPAVADSQADNDHSTLPFHSGEQSADSEKAMVESAAASVPFAVSSSGVLPVGTLLTVRLRDSITDAKPDSGTVFVASVQDPVVIDGNMLVARDTIVSGRLESALSSGVGSHRSYLRLTLVSIQVNGQDVPLQTSSLFARGEVLGSMTKTATAKTATAKTVTDKTATTKAALSQAAAVTVEGARGVHLPKGRFLTFRISSPVSLPGAGSTHLSKSSTPSCD